MYTYRSRPRGWRHVLEPWSRSGWCFAICRLCGLVRRWLHPRREGFAWCLTTARLTSRLRRYQCHAEPRGGDGRRAEGDIFWEPGHAARMLADGAGSRSPGNAHHRYRRRSVYPHVCAPRRFERDGLLPNWDDRVVGRPA